MLYRPSIRGGWLWQRHKAMFLGLLNGLINIWKCRTSVFFFCSEIEDKRKISRMRITYICQKNIYLNYLSRFHRFMADHDAWRELAEVYLSLQMYKQAAFCYEEVILAQPTVPLYHLAYADVLYILGGLENVQTAKKYYASTIDLTGGKNTRALFGICLCTSAIAQLTKGKNKEDKEGSQLQSLAAKALEKDYKQGAPDMLPQLTTALKSLTVSS
ncbi:uncharacterized protein LOC131602511 [Vicia villosa]|uniref:uncharacterized protein LOC131602511 n=1 Tax=Vicia villosa TaxID=3911 RepID=UPI00273BC2ED|nr:uncharacterized protein LOC131602511 [Vicia villosa]